MKRVCAICGRGEDQTVVSYAGGVLLCSKHRSQWYRHHCFNDDTIYASNEYEYFDDHAEIILKDKNCTEVGRALIDLDDVEKCKPYKWHIRKGNYVIASIRGGNNEKLHLHRLITGYYGSVYVVDHINRNPLDNRKCNLRIVTQAMNSANNGFSGVIKTPGGKYQAHVTRNYQNIYIGTRDTYEEAVELRDKFVKEYDEQHSERIPQLMNFKNKYGETSFDTDGALLSFANPFRIEGCRFEKVSFEQFCNSCIALEEQEILHFDSIDEIREHYGNIKLPRRSTPDAAGYDFYMPFPAVFTPDNPVTLPTGIRVILNQGTFLMCVPRSGLGFKYGAGLINTTGVIDASYSESDNEGHIMAKITTREPFKLDAGDRFMQGIILQFFVTEDDNPLYDKRNGGFGSTGGTGA